MFSQVTSNDKLSMSLNVSTTIFASISKVLCNAIYSGTNTTLQIVLSTFIWDITHSYSKLTLVTSKVHIADLHPVDTELIHVVRRTDMTKLTDFSWGCKCT